MPDWIIRGTGPAPTIEVVGGVAPPAPPVVPVVPPVIPPPPVDTSPFSFPDQPSIPDNDPSKRYTYVEGTATEPMTREGGFYVALSEYPNPLPGFPYRYAGQIPDGRRLWVPENAAMLRPALIRRVLATGRP